MIGAGEIDLCFPSIIAFSGFVFAVLFKEYELGWLAVDRGASSSGLLVGFVNGILVAKVGIPSFIATLGTQFFWAGMATVLSGGKSYALRGAEDEFGLAMGSSGGRSPGLSLWLGQQISDAGAVDGAASSSFSGSSSTATASASTCCSSAIRTMSRASSASMSSARRSGSSR